MNVNGNGFFSCFIFDAGYDILSAIVCTETGPVFCIHIPSGGNEHERRLYPESERFSEEYLTQLFDQYYIGMRSIGKTMTTEDEIQYKKFLESINQSNNL